MLNNKEKVLLYSSNLWYFGEGMFGPLFAVFTQKVGGDILDITGASAVYIIVYGLLTIWVGKLADYKDNKRKLIIAGYFLNALFTFTYLLVRSPLDLFLVQIGLGIAAALATPTWDALYAEYEDKRHAGYVWGLASGESKVLTGVAIILGGLIVSYLSFNLLFAIMGVIQIISAVYLLTILKWRR